MTFFIQTDSTDCLHRISCTLCLLFTYCLFQSALKHVALSLCSLFTFKQAFGQLQQIIKRNELANTFQLHNRINSVVDSKFSVLVKVFKSFSNDNGPTLGSHTRVPPQGPGSRVPPQGLVSHFSGMLSCGSNRIITRC